MGRSSRGGRESEGTAKFCRVQYGVSGEIKKTFHPLFIQPYSNSPGQTQPHISSLVCCSPWVEILYLCFQMVSSSSLGQWGGRVPLTVRAEGC